MARKKSVNDYTDQAGRLSWMAYNSNNPERRAKVDHYRIAGFTRADELVRTPTYQNAMQKGIEQFRSGDISGGNKTYRDADNRKYSTTRQAQYARQRRAQGLNGG